MYGLGYPAVAAAATIGFVSVYIILDGFDIGAGMLMSRARGKAERGAICAAVTSTTYTSELWLVAAATAMYVSFPAAFRALAQALLIPISVMICAMILRLVALLARRRAGDRSELFWSRIFVAASFIVAGAQGFALGGYIRGTSVAADKFVGGLFDWFSPFSVLIVAALAVGYALLGASWLRFQAKGDVAVRAQSWTPALAVAGAFAMAAISAATLLVHPSVSARWGIALDGIEWRYFSVLAPLPVTAAVCLGAIIAQGRRGADASAFVLTIITFAAGFAGLIASVWPYVVPFGFTIERAAAGDADLARALLRLGCAAPILMVVSLLPHRAWVRQQSLIS